MNLDERLAQDIKKKPLKDPYYDDEPDYAGYLDREKQPFINEYRGAFTLKDDKSLNKRPDVFERTAVFKVSGGSDDEIR